jgi:hypothetical protein
LKNVRLPRAVTAGPPEVLTNEERRARIYAGAGHPTVPREVTRKTPLAKLNLNWTERDLPERIRTKHVHRLHPYLGKFIPQLVEVFLRKYFSSGQSVLDPFCGSGTTLVQANELGIRSVGYDVSAFNVLLSRVKTRAYAVETVRREVIDILDKVRAMVMATGGQLSFLSEMTAAVGVSETDDEYLKEWYSPRALSELMTYRRLVESEGYEYGDLLKIILSRSARSARLTTHFDLDFPKKPQRDPYWCYKHSRTCSPTTEALKFLDRYSLDTVRRIEEFSAARTNSLVEVHHADSRTAVFPPVDGLITSPPYVGLIDYHDQHAYAYHLLGLVDKSTDEIGPATNGSGRKSQKEYQEAIGEVLRRAAASMPSGAPLIVVAADRHDLYGDIVKLAGLETEAVVRRHVNRRTGRRSTEFYESVFILRKR